MKVFEYMGINSVPVSYDHINNKFNQEYPPIDGNLIVLAINKMRDKGDWDKFKTFCLDKFGAWETTNNIEFWLFGNPANFFKLMEEWPKEKEK